MGGVVSNGVPPSNSVIEIRPDGSTLFKVKVLAGVAAISPGSNGLLAICENELQLLPLQPASGDAPPTVYDYTMIPFWSITNEFFAFKHRSEDGAVATMVRLATQQAKQISETLRQVCILNICRVACGPKPGPVRMSARSHESLIDTC